jgi:glycosyltransferase involved in cell wall biosynthesis
MKKVIFAVTTDLNYDQRMQRICLSLHKLGYEVSLIGREWKNSEPLTSRPYFQHRLKCFFRQGKLFYAEYNLRLWLYLASRKFNAYCAVDLDTALPLFFRAQSARALFGYDAHEYFPETPEVTGRPGVKMVWETMEKFVVTKTDFAYTVTASIAQIFERKYGRPFDVIRNVSPYHDFTSPLKPDKYILYQGALNVGRGLEALLEAMPTVEARLVICGEGDLSHSLRQQAQDLGLGEKVTFTGYLLPEDLLTVTRGAWVGVMLLEHKGLSYYLSLSNKFFDYVQAGIPQVAVDFPEYRALNEQYGVADLVRVDPKAISEALNRLLLDQDHYDTLARNCERAREELNWQREEQKLAAIYRQLWKEKTPVQKSALS